MNQKRNVRYAYMAPAGFIVGLATIVLCAGVGQQASTESALPTSNESPSPELTAREWLAAMDVGDSTRAIQLSKADENAKTYVTALASATGGAVDLELAAAERLGDAGSRMVGRAVHFATHLGRYDAPVVIGDKATMRDSKPPHGELRFLLIGKEWKLDLTGSWYEAMTAGQSRPLDYYLKIDRAAASELQRVTAMLNAGTIRSTDELRIELRRISSHLATLEGQLAATQP